jgi:hypothetical protein
VRARGSSEHLPDTSLDDDPADGSFSGSPHLGPGDLAPDEERLLAALERDAAALRADPVEDFLAGIRAARADTSPQLPLPTPDDGLTPLFTAPDQM